MALVKLSHSITSIKGRQGGIYWKRDPNGQHIQAMPRVWNYTRSPAQIGRASFFEGLPGFGIAGYSGAATMWLAALCAFFAAAWAIFAVGYYFYRIGKEPKKISGYNWYMHYALAFPDAGRPPLWKPPYSPNNIPDHIVTYRGRWQYDHAPPGWPAESPGGYYRKGIEWNGEPSYHTEDYGKFLWWRGDKWILSDGIGEDGPPNTFVELLDEKIGWYHNPTSGTNARVDWGFRPRD